MSPTSSESRDDLTVIKGIGEATERWLRKSFKVGTMRDLAVLSADQIEARLRKTGKPVARSRIDNWLAQARELAGLGSVPSPTQDDSESSAAARRSVRSGGVNDWTPFASFVVEFQSPNGDRQSPEQRTTVHHVELDKTDEWPGIDVSRLCQWMVERLREVTTPPRQERAPEETPVPPSGTGSHDSPVRGTVGVPPLTIDVTQVRVFQPPNTELPQVIGTSGSAGIGLIRAGEPLAFELSFELGGPEALDTAKRHTPFHAEVHAHSRSTTAEKHLTDREPMATQEDKLSYTTVLPEAVLERGTYRLDCMASLDGTPRRQGYLKVPILKAL